jgi:hypothetical protein
MPFQTSGFLMRIIENLADQSPKDEGAPQTSNVKETQERKHLKVVNFSLVLDMNAPQTLEGNLALPVKIFAPGTVDCRLRIETIFPQDKKMINFLMISNPPHRNSCDFNGRGLIVFTEADKLVVIEREKLLPNNAILGELDRKDSWGKHKSLNILMTGIDFLQKCSGEDTSKFGMPAMADKSLFKTAIKAPGLGFPIVSIKFSGKNPSLLLAVGLHQVAVSQLDKTGKQIKALLLDLKIPQDYIVKASWLSNSDVRDF